MNRDRKKLYKNARAGRIKNFTGISDPYEKPAKPDIHIKSGISDKGECVRKIIDYLIQRNFIH